MKVFRYQLNPNGEGPAGRLPAGSLTGYFSDPYYYGAAIINDFTGLEEFNPVEITPLEFNQLFTPAPTTEVPDPVPALVAFQDTVRNYYAQKLKEVVAPYTIEERETWFIQLKEAQDWLANNSSPTPMLSAIAAARNSTVADMVQGVIERNDVYRTSIGTVLGEQQKIIESLWAK